MSTKNLPQTLRNHADELENLPPGSREAKMVIFKVYTIAAELLGRNSPGAISEDTKVRIKGLFSQPHGLSYRPSYGNNGTKRGIDGFIQDQVAPYLDPDMLTDLGDGIPGFSLKSYHPGTSGNKNLKRFYENFAYAIRNTRQSGDDRVLVERFSEPTDLDRINVVFAE